MDDSKLALLGGLWAWLGLASRLASWLVWLYFAFGFDWLTGLAYWLIGFMLGFMWFWVHLAYLASYAHHAYHAYQLALSVYQT